MAAGLPAGFLMTELTPIEEQVCKGIGRLWASAYGADKDNEYINRQARAEFAFGKMTGRHMRLDRWQKQPTRPAYGSLDNGGDLPFVPRVYILPELMPRYVHNFGIEIDYGPDAPILEHDIYCPVHVVPREGEPDMFVLPGYVLGKAIHQYGKPVNELTLIVREEVLEKPEHLIVFYHCTEIDHFSETRKLRYADTETALTGQVPDLSDLKPKSGKKATGGAFD